MDILSLTSPVSAPPVQAPVLPAGGQSTGFADFIAQYLGLIEEAGEPAESEAADSAQEGILPPDPGADLPRPAGSDDAQPQPVRESPEKRIEAIVARWTGITATVDDTPAPDDFSEPVARMPEAEGQSRSALLPAMPPASRPLRGESASPAAAPIIAALGAAAEADAADMSVNPIPAADAEVTAAHPTAMQPGTEIKADKPISADIDPEPKQSQAVPPSSARTDLAEPPREPSRADIAKTPQPLATAAIIPRLQVADMAPVSAIPVADTGWQPEFVPHLRAEAPPPRLIEAQAPAISRQLAQAAVTLREGEIELALAPEELGRLRLRIEQTDHRAIVTVWFERPEVLEAARRHLDLLIQDLQDSGFDSPELDLHPEADPQENPRDDGAHDRPGAAEPGVETTMRPPERPVRLSDRPLDIRV